MKIQESAENYLETILILSQRKGNGMVRSIDIVNEIEFTKPSVSVAMKRLRENGYVNMDDNNLLTLTESGLAIARSIYERHQVISGYLMSIGVSEETALKDACRIEHVLSEETFHKIKEIFYQSRK